MRNKTKQQTNTDEAMLLAFAAGAKYYRPTNPFNPFNIFRKKDD